MNTTKSTAFDLSFITENVLKAVNTHELGNTGEYTRWLFQNEEGDRKLGLNAYGVADAANLLYTIGHFPREQEERAAWIRVFQNLQDPETGFFDPGGAHHAIHCTAHCIAALELFDAKPLHPVKSLAPYKDIPAMHAFLDQLDWKNTPWGQSHRGAGLFAALVLNEEVSAEWQDAYFDWLWEESDPETGFFRKDCVAPIPCWGAKGGRITMFPHLAGTFHYLFNIEYGKRPLRYPEKMIDTCMALYREKETFLTDSIGFAAIDWVFCMTRAGKQTAYLFEERRAMLLDFLAKHIDFWKRLDWDTHKRIDDLHALFGAICTFAELQRAIPGCIVTERPLKLVLDRRPFI